MFDFIASALIGGATSLFGANKAEKAQQRVQDKQLDFQRESKAEAKELLTPFIDSGSNALMKVREALGLEGGDKQQAYYDEFQTDPGFEAGLDNALTDTMKKYSIYGDVGGGLAKDLVKTGQQARYSQYAQRLQQLTNLATTGQNAAQSFAGMSQNYANASGNIVQNTSTPYSATGVVNAGNALIGGIQNNALMNMWNKGTQAAQNVMNPWKTQTVNYAGI